MKLPANEAMSREAAIALLNSADSPFATNPVSIRGVEFEVFSHAPSDMRDYFNFPNTHFPNRDFLIYEDERLTFGEVHRKSVALAHSLKRIGVQPGDRVAISMRNYPEYVFAVEATLALGAIAVTLNSWWEADEMRYGIEDSGARLAIVDEERWDRLKLSFDLLDLGVIVARAENDVPSHVMKLDSLLAGDTDESFPEVDIDTDSDAIIMYTSGSTGHPKGVVMTHRSIISALMNFSFIGMLAVLMQDVDKESRGEVLAWLTQGADAVEDPIALRLPAASMLLNVPLFHVSGLHTMLFLSYRGARKLVMMRKWNAEEALMLAERESIGRIEGVPTMIGEILNSPDLAKRDLQALTNIGGGGSARPPEHVKLLQRYLPNAVPGTGYGMTETDSAGTTISGPDYVARPSSVGRPSPPLMFIEVRDESGNVLGPNEEGEICMKSAANMRCYWNKPEATKSALRDGWIYSGDLGHVDEEGFVYITGRAKDIIIRGGENIAAAEIENVLYECPAVAETAVHGAPDERLGEIVCATIYLVPGQEVSESELKEHVGQQLAAYKVPAHVFITKEPLPRIASGKFDKLSLKQRAIENLDPN